MKNIFIIGARGYHSNYGGWETFVSNLVDNYKDPNTKFYISSITTDQEEIQYDVNNNLTVTPIYIPQKGSIKMFLYSIKAFNHYLKYIEENKIEDCYIYILGLKLCHYLKLKEKKLQTLQIQVFVNPDGLEHKRSKWSYPIKKFFLLSENLMLNHCNLIICDGLGIQKYINNKYPKLKDKTRYIAYGSNQIDLSQINETEILDEYHLISHNYCLMVGRCVPENNYELVINDFINSNITKDLVIISNLSTSSYYQQLLKITNCTKDSRIKFIDGVYDQKKLACIRKNAYLYIHGHSVGGTNPSLIEALSLTNLNLLYDVCFNHDIGMDSCLYFEKPGSLTQILNNQELLDQSQQLGIKAKKIVENNFTWDIIVNQYKQIFNSPPAQKLKNKSLD